MLILTRRLGESLIVGENETVITVVGIKGNQVRVGIKTTGNLAIDREELYLRKQQKEDHHDEQRENKKSRSVFKRASPHGYRHRSQ